MRTKIVILVVAVVLGVLGAFFAARYLSSARADIQAQAEPVLVLVAERDLPVGMSAEEIVNKQYAKATEIPRQYVSDGAVASASSLQGQVLGSQVSRGEQLTVGRFRLASDVGLAYSIPDGYVAVSVPDNPTRGVSGFVKPGDNVMVIASFSVDEAITKTLLDRARVIAVGAETSQTVTAASSDGQESQGGLMNQTSNSESSSGDGPRTITLAVTPVDAERIVFAQETGSVWYALISPTTTKIPLSDGQTYPQVLE